MANKKIKAVIFDLGDTIINFGNVDTALFFKRVHLSYEYLKALNQPLPKFKIYALKNLLTLRLRYTISNITGNDFGALSLLKKIGKKYNLTNQQWQQVSWLWYQPLSEIASVEPDIKKTLTTLKKMNLKLGILSNTFVNASSLNRHLKQFDLLDCFDQILYSYQFPHRKPNPQIFKAAAKKFNIPTKNIAFVGDRIDKDIIPSLKLNMTAFLKSAYTNHAKTPPPNTHKIDSLDQIPDIIKQINQL